MTRWIKRIIIAFLGLVLIGFGGIAGLLIFETNKWHRNYIASVREIIPAKIKTDKILADDYEQALPGGWCDGMAYQISEETLNDIEKQGIAFFKDLAPAEPIKTREGDSYWTEWKEKTGTTLDEGAGVSSCLSEFEKFKKRKKYSVTRDTKQYFTYVKHRGYSNISVFPEWGIVVYSSYAN